MLDPKGSKLRALLPETRTKSMMAVQAAMNSVVGFPMYTNIYGYQLGVHANSMAHMAEVEAMGAMHWAHDEGKIAEAFESVYAVLKREYPGGFEFSTFRKV
jgi:hypothetical protein